MVDINLCLEFFRKPCGNNSGELILAPVRIDEKDEYY